MNTRLLIAPLAILLAAGCATQSSSSPRFSRTAPDLSGTAWIVTRIDGQAPVATAVLNADFGADGRVSGDSGCNRFSGPFIQTGSTVQFGELLSTRRACVDAERQRQEDRLMDILEGATTVRYSRGQLSVRGKSGTLMLTQRI